MVTALFTAHRIRQSADRVLNLARSLVGIALLSPSLEVMAAAMVCSRQGAHFCRPALQAVFKIPATAEGSGSPRN
jgi:hypothetical protein